MTHARFARRAAVRQARRLATKGLIRRTLLAERLEERSLMAADLMPAAFKSDYWNSNVPTDVNADGVVAPLDAVLVINRLNAGGSGALPQGAAGEGAQAAIPAYFDVNNDGVVAPLDAVLVINALNAEGEGPLGEIVQYTIRALKPGTSGDSPSDVITTIEQGQEYDLQVLVQDLRADIGVRGAFSAYLDVIYSNKALTSVRVAELQQLTLNRGNAGQTGTFTLSFNGQTTTPITNTGSATALAPTLKNALGALSSIGGADKIDVQAVSGGAGGNQLVWTVRFIGSFDVDQPLITGNASGINATAAVTAVESVKGDPTVPASFTEAFRSRFFPGFDPTAFPGPYQNGLFAVDAADRIDDLGAFGGVVDENTDPGVDPVELVRTRMRANQVGTQTFTGSVADTIPDTHDTVVYANDGESSAVAKDKILIVNTTLTITPLSTPNGTPVNTVPGVQSINEDQTLVFSQANGNRIAISDPDAGSASVKVTLGVTNGSLTLSGLSGLTFTTGDGTADGSMVFTGSIAAINNALTGMSFTPTPEFPAATSGTAVLTITTDDQGNSGVGGAKTDTDTVNINIAGINDAPVVALPAGPLSVASITTLPFTGANAISITDADSGSNAVRTTVAVSSTGSGNPGTLTLGSTTGLTFTVGDGSGDATMTFTGTQAATDTAIKTLVYTPVDILTVTLTVTTNDQGNTGGGGAQQGTDSVTIDVIPPALPFARSDSRTIDEGSTTPLTIDVLARVLVNPGAQAILIGITDPPAGQGTVAIDFGPGQSAGNNTDLFDDQVIYTPPGGEFSGTVNFTYTANESPARVPADPDSTGTVSIIINSVNDPPVAANDLFQATINTPATIPAPGVLGAAGGGLDTDPENDPLTAILVAGPASGVLSLSANGGFTYTPATGFGGDVSFTYKANDGTVDSNVATVTIHVAAPPVAANDTFTADEDVTLNVAARGVLINDTDPTENRPQFLTAVLGTGPAKGTLTLNADGSFSYRGNQDFFGSDSFTYRATDSGRDSNLATVTITVNEIPDNPTANPDAFQAVKRNGAVGVDQVVPVIGNDSIAPDVNETFTVTAVNGGTGPSPTTAGGSVRLQGGQILYTSPTSIGTDTFTYTITDSRGGTATATVTVTVVDFVPKDVTGRVYLDDDNDGVIDGTEKGLGGITVQLSGTDFTNTAVLLSTVTDANGNYAFLGLRPGAYTLQELQPLYLLDGLDTEPSALVAKPAGTNDRFTMSWEAIDQSGPITNVNFGERGVDISSLTDARGVIQELLASSQPAEGFWLATDLSGTARWSFTLAGWANATSVTFDLNADLSAGILTVTDASGVTYTRSLPVDPPGVNASTYPRIRIIGQAANGDRIIRIDCTASELGLNLLAAPSVAAAAVPQGEGEGAQFAEAADALFAGQAWA